jgi:general secretion pathway protein B
MSYILDALKKADAERERDAAAVPDLHAQLDAGADRRPVRSHVGRNAALMAAGLISAAVAWWWFDAAPSPAPAKLGSPEQTTPPAQVATPPQPATPPPQVAAPLPQPNQPRQVATPPQLATPPALRVAPSPPARATAPTPVPTSAHAPVAAPAIARAVPPPAPKTAMAPALPPQAAASAATAPRVPLMSELPAELRAQLPMLSVGGSVYSPAAASRMVILNGQVFREGDTPVEGLTVERIGLKSTVLAFRGVRFELKH